MTPARVAASLREIADRIDRSAQPSKQRVNAAVRAVLASMNEGVAESGDPTKPGGYRLEMTEVTKRPNKPAAKFQGLVDGNPVAGVMTLLLDDAGEVGGWDWKNGTVNGKPGFDIAQDPEGIQQIVMDAVADFLGVS